jgi:hypothetical protein
MRLRSKVNEWCIEYTLLWAKGFPEAISAVLASYLQTETNQNWIKTIQMGG